MCIRDRPCIERSRKAFVEKWFDPQTGDFCKGIGGANAFAIQLGLGDERTKENLIERYWSCLLYTSRISQEGFFYVCAIGVEGAIFRMVA